jgi:hypothetical protein
MINTLPHEIAHLAKLLDFLDDQKYKIYCIREMFHNMRKEGKTVEKCELEVGEHYNLEPTTIHAIIYRKK